MADKTPASRFSKIGAKQLTIEFETAKKDRHLAADKFVALCAARNISADNLTYLKVVQECEAKLESLQSLLNEITSRDTTFVDKNRDKIVEDTRTAYVEFLANLVPSTPRPVPRPASPIMHNVQVPTFDGKVENWPGFKTFYDSLVHSADQNNLIKFHCLRSALKGPAAKIIEGITVSADNYESAYQKVVDQFTNGQRLASFYYKRLKNIKPITKPGPTAFREFINEHAIAIEGLKAQEIPDLADYLCVQSSLAKLCEEIRLGYESTLGPKDFPNTRSLTEYLTTQARVLENVANLSGITHRTERVCLSANLEDDKQSEARALYSGRGRGRIGDEIARPTKATPSNPPPRHEFSPNMTRRSPSPASSSGSNYNLVTEERNTQPRTQHQMSGRRSPIPRVRRCKTCPSENHSIHNCPTFKKLGSKERYETVKSLDLCVRCLGPHDSRNCRSVSGCVFCGRQGHNTHLHQYWEQRQKLKEVENAQH